MKGKISDVSQLQAALSEAAHYLNVARFATMSLTRESGGADPGYKGQLAMVKEAVANQVNLVTETWEASKEL